MQTYHDIQDMNGSCVIKNIIWISVHKIIPMLDFRMFFIDIEKCQNFLNASQSFTLLHNACDMSKVKVSNGQSVKKLSHNCLS